MFLPHDKLHKLVPQTRSGDSILLHPRPRTHPEIKLALVPLLPTPKCVQLPGEIWARILLWTMQPEQDPRTAWEGQRVRLVLVRVCKSFKDVQELVSPMLYANPHLPTLGAFLRFSERLVESDRRWDNLRRISYSTPGRWLRTLNLSLIRHLSATEYLQFDQGFIAISTMLPFLQQLLLHPTVMLTRRAMSSIADTETALSLVHLTGIHVPASTQPRARASLEDPLTNLIRCCINLRHIELLGTGLDVDSDAEEDPGTSTPQGINLPYLQSMAVLHVPYCPLLRTLANSELPSLRALTISLYTSAPHTDSTKFFEAHASKLTGLTLFTAQTWPPTSTHAPPDLLLKTPNLVYLSLPSSAHRLIAPAIKSIKHTIESTPPASPSPPASDGIPASSSPSAFLASSSPPLSSSPMRARSASQDRISLSPHPLRTLSIPRPTPELLSRVVEPIFKELREVHIREVRYLRRGMGKSAEGAGSSASMTEWRWRLARRGVRVIDALGKDGPN